MSTNYLALPGYQKVGRSARMSSLSETIGRNVARFRIEANLSPQKLADKVGVRLYTIQQIEKGATAKSKWLPDIARVLNKPLSAIDPSQAEGQETVETNTPVPRGDVAGKRDVPLYASVEAGEGVLVMSNTPVEWTYRPAELETVQGVYGINVSGDSMKPLLRPGDTVIVHPHRHPRRDDLCIFRSDLHGEFRGIVKEFVAETADGWKVKRYFPKEKEYLIKKKDWQVCHVVVTIHRR